MSEKGGNCIGTRDSEVGQSIFEARGIRESSFNMTRGGMKILRGPGSENF